MGKTFEINGDETFKATINDFKNLQQTLATLNIGESTTITSRVNNIPVPIKRVEDKPKFIVVDSAPKKFITKR